MEWRAEPQHTADKFPCRSDGFDSLEQDRSLKFSQSEGAYVR
jgi:hypothetical protein